MKRIINENLSTIIYILSVNEGLTETEIAKKLGISRSTVSRVKKQFNIPKRVLKNRKDKFYICPFCNKKIYIKRCDSLKLMCDKCRDKISQSI